jgi:hypothetical protein
MVMVVLPGSGAALRAVWEISIVLSELGRAIRMREIPAVVQGLDLVVLMVRVVSAVSPG